MESSPLSDAERRELRGLIERIRRGDCVLVLGPHVAIRADDTERRPLDELLAAELFATVGAAGSECALSPPNLRRAADLHYRLRQDREDLELAVQEFYEREAASTTDFHRDLAQLPFRLCVSASPDSLMLAALQEAKPSRRPQRGYYSFKKAMKVSYSPPTPEQPLVYYLFGHHSDASSLVLTEGDLVEFLVSVVRGTPSLPDEVRSILADPASSFLFLGFGFHNWYLRVLLHVMNVYGHRSKAMAFEDLKFFADPEHEQAVGFYSGNRLIDFRPLRWELFARQLREAYEAVTPRKAETAAAPERSPNAPKVFISYASEDRDAVTELAESLETRGINVWQDKQDLRVGDKWNQLLVEVIAKKVDYVVVVQTPNMFSRAEGVFNEEISAALQRQGRQSEFEGQTLRFILPVRLGDCQPRSDLAQFHVIDVGDTKGIDLLVQSIHEDRQRRTALKSVSEVRA